MNWPYRVSDLIEQNERRIASLEQMKAQSDARASEFISNLDPTKLQHQRDSQRYDGKRQAFEQVNQQLRAMIGEAGLEDYLEPSPQVIGRFFDALENPKYPWRTLHGIAHEADLNFETVYWLLRRFGNEGIVVRSSRTDMDGHALYTTRSRWNRDASFWTKLRAAFMMRIP